MRSFEDLVKQFGIFFTREHSFLKAPESLYEPCNYFLSLGGKRVRPVLCLMASELFGEIHEDAWHAAAGIELFHNFTLIHDDIMDKAPLRRGKTTLHERNGLTAGILCGDVISIHAYASIARIKNALPEVLSLFNKTAIAVCEGQQLDMDYEHRDDISISEYLHMIMLKTSVLIACSLKTGAILGGASPEEAQRLYDFGLHIGMAFQLKDDYLDAFGIEAQTGKQQGGDIRANKKTYLLLKAIESGSAGQQQEIRRLMETNDPGKVNTMLDIFRETGAEQACLGIISEYSEKAFSGLAGLSVPAERKVPLHQLALYLLEREK